MDKEAMIESLKQIKAKQAEARKLSTEVLECLDEQGRLAERLVKLSDEIYDLQDHKSARHKKLQEEFNQCNEKIDQLHERNESRKASRDSAWGEALALEAPLSAFQLAWMEKEVQPVVDRKIAIISAKYDSERFSKKIKWGMILFFAGLAAAVPFIFSSRNVGYNLGYVFLLVAVVGAFRVFGTIRSKNTKKHFESIMQYPEFFSVDPNNMIEMAKWIFHFNKSGALEAEEKMKESVKGLEKSDVVQAELAIDDSFDFGYVVERFGRVVKTMKEEKYCLSHAQIIVERKEMKDEIEKAEKQLERLKALNERREVRMNQLANQPETESTE